MFCSFWEVVSTYSLIDIDQVLRKSTSCIERRLLPFDLMTDQCQSVLRCGWLTGGSDRQMTCEDLISSLHDRSKCSNCRVIFFSKDLWPIKEHGVRRNGITLERGLHFHLTLLHRNTIIQKRYKLSFSLSLFVFPSILSSNILLSLSYFLKLFVFTIFHSQPDFLLTLSYSSFLCLS